MDLNKLKISYILTQAGLEKILDELVGVDVSYLDWAACSDDASLKDARMQLRHTLDLHHRLIEMKKFSEAAEKALAQYGLELGTVFQLIDDILDYSSQAIDMGMIRSGQNSSIRSRGDGCSSAFQV